MKRTTMDVLCRCLETCDGVSQYSGAHIEYQRRVREAYNLCVEYQRTRPAGASEKRRVLCRVLGLLTTWFSDDALLGRNHRFYLLAQRAAGICVGALCEDGSYDQFFFKFAAEFAKESIASTDNTVIEVSELGQPQRDIS